MMDLENIYILGAVRTAIGKYGGSLKNVPAHELGALVIREALTRSGVPDEMVDEVILGEVRQTTEASNVARCALLEAGLPEHIPGFTVNRLCASSMQAVLEGCREIRCGDADVIVAGGTENLSRAPIFLRGARWGGNRPSLVDSNIEAGSTAAPASVYGAGGISNVQTAENVAERFGITRDMQDAFAAESQRRALFARENGWFRKEIVPVTVKEKKSEFVFDTDEFIRPGTTKESLGKLRTLLPGGTVTAGNACGLNDGASALVLMGEKKLRETGHKPQARIIGMAAAAISPEIMGYAPVAAVKKVLEKTGMSLAQIDLVELNEAFASQAVACIRDLPLDPERVNIGGGAIALGHPLGCTGTRLIVTLLHHLMRTGGRYGIATLCIAGGQSMAAIIENLEGESKI